MSLNLSIPDTYSTMKPSITVFGVGGAGGNAVNNMINSKLEGVKFVAANTDHQSIEYSLADIKIQLGTSVTRGLGAGSSPDVGRAAAEESADEIIESLAGSNMVFITAGMGGGTGTGAAPVIARLASEQGILTVGVVTKPFHFEGAHRMRTAELGLEELQKFVDTLIVIPNQNLFRIATESTTFADAFKLADNVLHSGVRGITDLMVMPGLINLDFADVRTVMSQMGKAMMGTGEAEGDNRAVKAAEAAISNPLLDNISMKGARGVLINITGGADMTLFEVDEAANRIRDEVDPDANIIFGSAFNQELQGKIRVSVVSTGISHDNYGADNKNKTFVVQQSSSNTASQAPRQNIAPQQNYNQESEPQKAPASSNYASSNPQYQSQNPVKAAAANLKDTDIEQRARMRQQEILRHQVRPQQATPQPFVAPKPVEPKSVPYSSSGSNFSQSNHNYDNTQQNNKESFVESPIITPRAAENNDAREETKSAFNLFKMNTNLKQTRDDKPQKSDSDLEFAEDILDIPAFLRRESKDDKGDF